MKSIPGTLPLILLALTLSHAGHSVAETESRSVPSTQTRSSPLQPPSDASNIEIADVDEIPAREMVPKSVSEARARARILHEAIHGSLQVMHRDFFREDEGLRIPSRSLEDVFSELSRSYGVKLHWIAVDLKAMSIDNEPESDFDKQSVLALKSGKEDFESASEGEYRFAGRIRLSATCLSCHEPRRSSNDTRSAALVITMPLAKTTSP